MRNGKIEIELEKLNYSYVLTYRDNGAGIANVTDISESKSFGMQLVYTLVEQLEGTFELNINPGVEFKIIFKRLQYKIRI